MMVLDLETENKLVDGGWAVHNMVAGQGINLTHRPPPSVGQLRVAWDLHEHSVCNVEWCNEAVVNKANVQTQAGGSKSGKIYICPNHLANITLYLLSTKPMKVEYASDE